MPEVLSRSAKRKINTRKKLIRASYKIFSQKGLFRATLDEITEEADVGKGTVYCHFRNKPDLISCLTKKSIDDLLNYCKQSDYKKYISFLADTLDQGIKKGVFRSFNSVNQAYVLHGTIIGFISQWIINERKGPFVDKAELITQTFLRGIIAAEHKEEHKKKSCQMGAKKSPKG